MESEADESSLIDQPDGSTVRLLGPDARVVVRHRGTRGSGGGASTHSLNEADLQVKENLFDSNCHCKKNYFYWTVILQRENNFLHQSQTYFAKNEFYIYKKVEK